MEVKTKTTPIVLLVLHKSLQCVSDFLLEQQKRPSIITTTATHNPHLYNKEYEIIETWC